MKLINLKNKLKSEQRCVVYSITTQLLYLDQLINSISSLRNYNEQIKIHVFIYGKAPKHYLLKLKSFSVQVHSRKELPKNLYPFLVKWMSIHSLIEERVLMLDTDTFFYRDVELLFKTFSTKNIYARLAPECQIAKKISKDKKEFQAIIPEVMAMYHKSQGTKHVPIINIGIVLFNFSFHKKISFKEILSSYNWLVSGKLPYPSVNTFNRGEFALSLALARIKNVTIGKLPDRLAPFYSELKTIDHEEKIVCHICYHNYYQFLASLKKSSLKSVLNKRAKHFLFLESVYRVSSNYRLGRPPIGQQYLEALPLDSNFRATAIKGPLVEILVLLNAQRTVSDILTLVSKPDHSISTDFIQSLKLNFRSLKQKGIIQEVK